MFAATSAVIVCWGQTTEPHRVTDCGPFLIRHATWRFISREDWQLNWCDWREQGLFYRSFHKRWLFHARIEWRAGRLSAPCCPCRNWPSVCSQTQCGHNISEGLFLGNREMRQNVFRVRGYCSEADVSDDSPAWTLHGKSVSKFMIRTLPPVAPLHVGLQQCKEGCWHMYLCSRCVCGGKRSFGAGQRVSTGSFSSLFPHTLTLFQLDWSQ